MVDVCDYSNIHRVHIASVRIDIDKSYHCVPSNKIKANVEIISAFHYTIIAATESRFEHAGENCIILRNSCVTLHIHI